MYRLSSQSVHTCRNGSVQCMHCFDLNNEYGHGFFENVKQIFVCIKITMINKHNKTNNKH